MTMLEDGMPRMRPFRRPTRPGTEEGEVCGRGGCRGIMAFPRPRNCSCHVMAPCPECGGLRPVCPECGWEPG
jgi:hypothetical protein